MSLNYEFIIEQIAQRPGMSSSADLALASRLKRAYRLGIESYGRHSVPRWVSFGPNGKPIYAALMASDDAPLAKILSDPVRSYLFYGMDNIYGGTRETEQPAMDGILQLASAIGLERCGEIEVALAALDRRLGIRIDFPNPFPGETGLLTSRGIASYRAPQAIYQAHRLREMCSVHGPRVIEIGAGTGRTAYYANRLGVTDYTIIDLPATLLASAAFLARTLGPDRIHVLGDDHVVGRIKLLPPPAFHRSAVKYDVALNADSLPEMRREDAERYFVALSGRCKSLLSINHQKNRLTTANVASVIPGVTVSARLKYPMRDDYNEEVFMIGGKCVDARQWRRRWALLAIRSWLGETRLAIADQITRRIYGKIIAGGTMGCD